MQEQIEKIINFYKEKFQDRLYLILPLEKARELQILFENVISSEMNICYFTEDPIGISRPIKPIVLHINNACTVEKVFVVQKINIELNDLFLDTI